MTVSGIVMACRPEHLGDTAAAVNDLPWAEVHYTDADGRLVVTIEAKNVDESMDRLKELQGIPRVVMAELAQFVVEDDDHECNQTKKTGNTIIETGRQS
jgi:nitrate reductase NapAB chaperone NapD